MSIRKQGFLFIFILSSLLVNAQNFIIFPDANLKERLLEADPFNYFAQNLSGDPCRIDINHDQEIQYTEAAQIGYLRLSQADIASIEGLQFFYGLIELDVCFNELTYLDVTIFSDLKNLYCYGNELTSLTYNHDSRLEVLVCGNNKLPNVDLSGLTGLQVLEVHDMPVSNLDLSEQHNLWRLVAYNCQLSSLNLTSNNLLKILDCSNNNLTSLGLDNLHDLIELNCGSNNLTELDLSGNPILESLKCSNNLLSDINFGAITHTLEGLTCGNNNLTSLDLTRFPNLFWLGCTNNKLVNLKIDGLKKLRNFDCSNNQLHELNFAGNDTLYQVTCEFNQLESINACNQPQLRNLFCSYNNLKSINIRNGVNLGWLEFAGNNNIESICGDESELLEIQELLDTYGYEECNLSSYCSCYPGGDIFSIVCKQNYDENMNGCDINDLPMPFMRYFITDGTSTGYLIGDGNGTSSLEVEPGTYTVIPESPLENQYYSYYPLSDTVTFPGPVSIKEMDFCLQPSGVYNDLEIYIMFQERAMPGFTTNYRIVYRNKGTTVQSDTIFFEYDHLVMQLYDEDPSAQILNDSVIMWQFTDLHPCQSEEIHLLFRLHSPTEIPPLNSGDIIHLKASINGEPDETPEDNISEVVQEIVNSLDPNDKTCMEGRNISPDKAGDYIHYLIRFENVGTANAVNVRVTDLIDTTMFIPSSLQPLEASHPFTTSITGNKAEFFFENINLPFDDETNDGYVLFKVRTNPAITDGSILENQADIVFDYNLPIITNVYSTTVGTVGLPEKNPTQLQLFPNPANDVIRFTSNIYNGSDYRIYNTLGITVDEGVVTHEWINTSDLPNGLYLLDVKGTTLKFIVK